MEKAFTIIFYTWATFQVVGPVVFLMYLGFKERG